MTQASIEERVIKIVCDNLKTTPDKVSKEANFITDLGADSLDIVAVMMDIEEEFKITVPDEEAEKIQTVRNAIDYITSKS